MAEIRIESGQADLVQLPTNDPGKFTPPEMNSDVGRYWGSPTSEQLFILPFWKADRLIAQSPSKQLALRVTDIEDPALVDARWISYDSANPGRDAAEVTGGVIGYFLNLIEVLKRQLGSDPPVTLFVFGEELYPASGENGLKHFKPYHQMNIVGRIGRNNADKTISYILAGNINLKTGPGTGGPGATTGAKIPADG